MYSLDEFLTIHGGFHGVTYKNRVAYMAGILVSTHRMNSFQQSWLEAGIHGKRAWRYRLGASTFVGWYIYIYMDMVIWYTVCVRLCKHLIHPLVITNVFETSQVVSLIMTHRSCWCHCWSFGPRVCQRGEATLGGGVKTAGVWHWGDTTTKIWSIESIEMEIDHPLISSPSITVWISDDIRLWLGLLTRFRSNLQCSSLNHQLIQIQAFEAAQYQSTALEHPRSLAL